MNRIGCQSGMGSAASATKAGLCPVVLRRCAGGNLYGWKPTCFRQSLPFGRGRYWLSEALCAPEKVINKSRSGKVCDPEKVNYTGIIQVGLPCDGYDACVGEVIFAHGRHVLC